MYCLLCCNTNNERLWISHTYIFRGKANQAAHDVERVFARLEHASQPVQPCIRVRAAQRLVQGGDRIIMLVAAFVIEQSAMLHHVLGDGERDMGTCGCSPTPLRRQFKRIESNAGITISKGGHLLQCVLVNRDVELAQAMLFICQCTPENS